MNDRLNDGDLPVSRLSRRQLLARGAIGAGALALGGSLLAACGDDGGSGASAGTGTGAAGSAGVNGGLGEKIRLGWGGGACEAPLYSAYHQGFFRDEGLDVELVRFSGSTINDALSTAKIHGAPGILFEWLKPIEQGLNVRLTTGLHRGCLRFVAGKDSGITELAQLRGKSVGTDAVGGSAMAFFSVDLAKAGIDPSKEIDWRIYPPDQLGTAIEKGEVPAIVGSDPFAWTVQQSGAGVEIGNNLSAEHRRQFCCTVALNKDLIDQYPDVAAKITRAWERGATWVGQNVPAAAQIEVDNRYVPVSRADIAKLLSSYVWAPGTDDFYNQLEQGAKDFKGTGYLDSSTDPVELARTAFVDVVAQAS